MSRASSTAAARARGARARNSPVAPPARRRRRTGWNEKWGRR